LPRFSEKAGAIQPRRLAQVPSERTAITNKESVHLS